MSWFNYHHLYYFHVIAREGSIAKASRILRIGQSALSIQLKTFEASLGVKLFERKAQKLRLTHVGKMVFSYATSIFKMGDEMVEAVQENKATTKIKVDIGVLDSVPKSVTHQLVVAALKLGDCFVSVVEGGGPELLQSLKQHKLHLVLTNSHAPLAPESDLLSRQIGEFPVVICAAPKFEKLKKSFPQSISGQPFILPTSHSKLRSDLEFFFKMNEVTPRILGESQESELDKRMALSGHAIIAISKHSVIEELGSGQLVSLGVLKSIKEQVWLTGIKRHIDNPIAATLLKDFFVR